ncbi:MAG: phosphate ABC transporter permease PstA [Leptospiraceae bacterium]|nr:phosphate ABC transporter permease PstA [Leptospiraceae bacterium]MBK9502238.1 phosphate ABC transporter permease PstA [Leptospiraceae bacterium]MBL0266207.1 phosphate ABC transporter permease PstA [Leptospiraceae bacterium]MBP9163247.1 phosphate ABC transporter permease PstA [Leptospiraceae bacterium]
MKNEFNKTKAKYAIFGVLFQTFCLAANFSVILFLVILLGDILIQGYSTLNWNFLTSYPSRFHDKAGILAAIVGTFYMMLLTALISVPLGIGAAIYLEEYAKETRFIRFVKLNIQNLAGVPSIIYGILGLTLFVRFMDLGRSLIAASLTMALLILPIITIASQEALRAVPQSFRLAGYGLGLTRWQVIQHQVLPMVATGMSTGVILALSRAIGESAPLVMVGALTYVAFLPSGLLDSFSVLSIQIYNWSSFPQKEFHALAASSIIVLLAMLFVLNVIAIGLRIYFQNKIRGINR